MGDLIPLVKATKPTAKKSGSKPKNTGSHTYTPSPGGIGKAPSEGDIAEFIHPKHGRKHRGRVTAVGQDGYRARIADGSAVDVPHTHHVATLPAGDFGTEKGLSPQDAKEAFLGPTREGGLPATDLQVAILDVMAQHGFPVDEESITKINYDDAQKLISKFIMDDKSAEASKGPASSDMQPGGSEAKDGTDMSPGGPQPPTEGSPEDQGAPPEGEEQPPEEGGDEGAVQPPSGLPEDQEPEGQSSAPTGDMGQPPMDEDTGKDGTDQSQDLSGPPGGGPETEEQDVNPEVLAAIQKLIAALEGSSESAGKKKNVPIVGKKKK